MEDDADGKYKPIPELRGTDEEKGWRFYIAAICNRRTVNDMLEDMWRCGEQAWVANVNGIVEKTNEAEKVLSSWYPPTFPIQIAIERPPTHTRPGIKCLATASPPPPQ